MVLLKPLEGIIVDRFFLGQADVFAVCGIALGGRLRHSRGLFTLGFRGSPTAPRESVVDEPLEVHQKRYERRPRVRERHQEARTEEKLRQRKEVVYVDILQPHVTTVRKNRPEE